MPEDTTGQKAAKEIQNRIERSDDGCVIIDDHNRDGYTGAVNILDKHAIPILAHFIDKAHQGSEEQTSEPRGWWCVWCNAPAKVDCSIQDGKDRKETCSICGTDLLQSRPHHPTAPMRQRAEEAADKLRRALRGKGHQLFISDNEQLHGPYSSQGFKLFTQHFLDAMTPQGEGKCRRFIIEQCPKCGCAGHTENEDGYKWPDVPSVWVCNDPECKNPWPWTGYSIVPEDHQPTAPMRQRAEEAAEKATMDLYNHCYLCRSANRELVAELLAQHFLDAMTPQGEGGKIDSDKLVRCVSQFIADNKISCAESICQCDWVITNAYDFIEKLCDIVGYFDYPEDDDTPTPPTPEPAGGGPFYEYTDEDLKTPEVEDLTTIIEGAKTALISVYEGRKALDRCALSIRIDFIFERLVKRLQHTPFPEPNDSALVDGVVKKLWDTLLDDAPSASWKEFDSSIRRALAPLVERIEELERANTD